MAITLAGLATGAKVVSGLAGVASSLFGGKQNSGASENRKQTEKLIKRKGELVREGAERSGFNPLTYLAANGGAPSVSGGAAPINAPLASFAAATGNLASVFDQLTADEATEKNTESAERQYQRVVNDQKNAGGVGPVIQRTTTVNNPVTISPAKLASKPENLWGDQNLHMAGIPDDWQGPLTFEQAHGPWSEGSTPVWHPDGTPRQLPTKIANRLKLKPGDVTMVEDNEALYGDEGGQVVSLPRIPGAIQTFDGGVWGSDPLERIEQHQNETRVTGWNPLNWKTPPLAEQLRGDRARNRSDRSQ